MPHTDASRCSSAVERLRHICKKTEDENASGDTKERLHLRSGIAVCQTRGKTLLNLSCRVLLLQHSGDFVLLVSGSGFVGFGFFYLATSNTYKIPDFNLL